MSVSPAFKAQIENHLNELAAKDELFAVTLKKENKNIDDCITYILNQVQKSGKMGFADDEIYGMAVHYYDEDDIQVGKKVSFFKSIKVFNLFCIFGVVYLHKSKHFF